MRLRMSRGLAPTARMTNSRFSYTVFFSMRRKSWKMTPSVLRIRGICLPEILVMEKPLIIMRPAVGTTSPVSSLLMVDLPEPEGPTRKTNSPSSMVRVIPRMALVPLSYSISTFFRRIIQAPRSVVLKSRPLGDGRHNSQLNHIISGFSPQCNRSLQFRPGKFCQFSANMYYCSSMPVQPTTS